MSDTPDRDGAELGPTGLACPVCGRPSAPGRLAPFCSLRCADVDLGRWFTEGYRVPAEDAPEVDPTGGVG